MCFRREKAELLKVINKDMHERRKEEDDAYADALGHKMSFEEYLQQDKHYQAELKKFGQRNPNEYQEHSSTRGMPT